MKQAKPEAEEPQASVAERTLLMDGADIMRALVYTSDLVAKERLTNVAKTWLARHEDVLGRPTVGEARKRALEIDRRELQDQLYRNIYV